MCGFWESDPCSYTLPFNGKGITKQVEGNVFVVVRGVCRGVNHEIGLFMTD